MESNRAGNGTRTYDQRDESIQGRERRGRVGGGRDAHLAWTDIKERVELRLDVGDERAEVIDTFITPLRCIWVEPARVLSQGTHILRHGHGRVEPSVSLCVEALDGARHLRLDRCYLLVA